MELAKRMHEREEKEEKMIRSNDVLVIKKRPTNGSYTI